MEVLYKWTLDDSPAKKGWYAIAYSWDTGEGIFHGSSYYDGEKWDCSLPIGAYAGPFENKLSAEKWGDDNDLECF